MPLKIWLGVTVLLSAHHFLIYARVVADELELESRAVEQPVMTTACVAASGS